MAFPVQGKTALVTGAGSGICLDLTKLLLSKKCNVVLVDLKLSPEAEELVKKHGEAGEGGEAKAAFKKTDVADWEELGKAFEFAVERFGGLDIVVPGAGIFEPEWSSFWHPQKTRDTLQRSSFATIDINLNHPIRATQLAISTFKSLSKSSKKQHKGAIILISSIAAQLPLFPYPLYACAKAGISSFVRSLAPLEQAMGIRVAAVAPGIVKTQIWSEEKLMMVNESVDEWVDTTRVAETMVKLIEEDKWEAGSVVEIGVDKLRPVQILGDEGPLGKGLEVTGDPGATVAGIFKALEEEFGT